MNKIQVFFSRKKVIFKRHLLLQSGCRYSSSKLSFLLSGLLPSLFCMLFLFYCFEYFFFVNSFFCFLCSASTLLDAQGFLYLFPFNSLLGINFYIPVTILFSKRVHSWSTSDFSACSRKSSIKFPKSSLNPA